MELFEESQKHKENREIFEQILDEIQSEHEEYFNESKLLASERQKLF
jgi:hypothetical protein